MYYCVTFGLLSMAAGGNATVLLLMLLLPVAPLLLVELACAGGAVAGADAAAEACSSDCFFRSDCSTRHRASRRAFCFLSDSISRLKLVFYWAQQHGTKPRRQYESFCRLCASHVTHLLCHLDESNVGLFALLLQYGAVLLELLDRLGHLQPCNDIRSSASLSLGRACVAHTCLL